MWLYYPRRGVYAFVCFFSTRYLKIHAARITKLDTEMFHHESWKFILEVKMSQVNVTRHIAGVGYDAPVSAGFFYFSCLNFRFNVVWTLASSCCSAWLPFVFSVYHHQFFSDFRSLKPI